MQRNFEPIRTLVDACQRSELTDVTAKVVIYEAFVGSSAWAMLFMKAKKGETRL